MRSNEILSFLLFIVGYILGRIDTIAGLFNKTRKIDSFVDKVNQDERQEAGNKKKLLIDDRKFLTKVSTGSFQKSAALGVKSEVNDNIENETSKLIMMKKKKG